MNRNPDAGAAAAPHDLPGHPDGPERRGVRLSAAGAGPRPPAPGAAGSHGTASNAVQ